MSESSLAESTSAVPMFSGFLPNRAVSVSSASSSFEGACFMESTMSVLSARKTPSLLDSLTSPWTRSIRSRAPPPVDVRRLGDVEGPLHRRRLFGVDGVEQRGRVHVADREVGPERIGTLGAARKHQLPVETRRAVVADRAEYMAPSTASDAGSR